MSESEAAPTQVFAGEVINGENTYAVYLHEKGLEQIREIIREEIRAALSQGAVWRWR